MITKMRMCKTPKSLHLNDSDVSSYTIVPGLAGACQQLDIWNATLSTGKTLNIEIGKLYNNARFTIELDSEEYSDLLSFCKTGTIVLNDFEHEITHIKELKDTWIEINGVPLKAEVDIPDVTKSEKMELYRIIYKWDIESREKSSGSESNSDSDFDERKLHNNCIHLMTKYAIIRGYKLMKL